MMRKGSITVYLSLIMLVMLSFVLALLDMARIGNSRARLARYADVAAEMTFSHYTVPLARRYGIFALDGGEENCLNLYRKSLEMNLDPSVKKPFASRISLAECELAGAQNLSDRNWEPLYDQIRRYMFYRLGSKGLSGLTDLAGKLNGGTDQVKDSFAGQLEQTGAAAQREKAQREAEEAAAAERGEALPAPPAPEPEQVFKDPRKGTASWLRGGIMRLAVADGPLSERGISTADCSFKTEPDRISKPAFDFMHEAQAVHDLENQPRTESLTDTAGGGTDALMLEWFIGDRFKCYTDDPDKTEGRTVLDYEREYIIFGMETDQENLENAVNAIFFIRMPFNLIYLYVDGGRDAELTRAVASLADAALPVAGQVIRLLLILCWASAESVVDCYALLHGKKVPVIKDAGSWNLSIDQIGELAGSGASPGSFIRDGSRGLDYGQYLLMLSMAKKPEKKLIRMTQLIEKNVRLEPGWEHFTIGSCITGATFSGKADIHGRFAEGMSMPSQTFRVSYTY